MNQLMNQVNQVVDSPALVAINIAHTEMKMVFLFHLCPLSRNLPLYPVPAIS